MRRWTLMVAVTVLLVSCDGVAGRPPQDPVLPSVLRLEPWFRDLRVVRAVTGGDTLRLLLDTGGGATLITPTVAAAMGCRPFGEDVGQRMNGERVAFARCDSLPLSIGSWHTVLRPVAVFDVNALLPDELPPLDGVLALDAFRGSLVTLDWPANVITVHPAAGALDTAWSLPVRWATGTSGRFLSAMIGVAGTRDTLWLLLDSGNLRGTLLSNAVARDSLLPLVGPRKIEWAIAGRPVVRESFEPAELVIDGVLGTDFLLRGAVTLDLRRPDPPRR